MRYYRPEKKEPKGKRGPDEKYPFATMAIGENFSFRVDLFSMRAMVARKSKKFWPKRFAVKKDLMNDEWFVYRTADDKVTVTANSNGESVRVGSVKDLQIAYYTWVEKHGADDGMPIEEEALIELHGVFNRLKLVAWQRQIAVVS